MFTIIDDNGEEVHQGCAGEVAIKGPSVIPGYLDNPEANAKSFTADGYFRTGDQGEIDDLGHVRLTGRLKELINKGGEKISPNEVDQAVLQHEGIAEAVAFAAPDELYGEEIAIAVVLRPGSDLKPAALKQWLRGRISDFKLPQHIYILDAIPKTATGKVQRTGLSTLAIHSDGLSDGQKGDLQALWGEILGIEQGSITEEQDFFNLGGNSVQAIKLAAKAKAKGWSLDAATVFRHPTFKEMSQHCGKQPENSGQRATASTRDVGDLRTNAAHACGIFASLVQDLAPSTPLQRVLASLNRDFGLWGLSLIFSCQNVDLARLETIVEAMRSRHPILRARTVQIGSETYNAVVDDQAVWETSSSLSKYLSQVEGVRIPYGSPQMRFAFIEDIVEGSHFIITTNHAVQDVWTRILLYEELRVGLDDIGKLQELPSPTSFCDFARYAASYDPGEAECYWSSLLDGFDRWSYLNRDGDDSATGVHRSYRAIHPKSKTSHDFGDVTRVHLAWCLTLSLLSNEERIYFPSVSGGRLADISGIEKMMGPTMTTIPVCIDLTTFNTVAEAIARLREVLYDSVRYETSAPEHITRHFKTRERETLLNCSEVPEYDGMEIGGNGSSLRFRTDNDKGLYGKISVLMNMRVTKREESLQLEAAYDPSGLSSGTVQSMLKCFGGFLQAVNSARPEMSLAVLKEDIRGDGS